MEPTAGTYIIRGMAEPVRRFLDAEGLPAPECRAALDRLPAEGHLPVPQWAGLLELVAEACPRPALGLAIGAHVAPRDIGVVGYLAVSCETLAEAVLRYQRYGRLVFDANATHVALEGDQVVMSWGSERGDFGHIVDATSIAVFATVIRRVVGKPLTATSVVFAGTAADEGAPPPDPRPYEAFFGCPVTFGGERTVVTFPAAHLAERISHADPALRALLDQQAEALLRALPETDAFREALNQALVRALQDGEPLLGQVAARLGLSPRTLQRRLDERGLGFHAQLDLTRCALAERYLGDDSLTLAEVALLLGYSEQSAFNRAFRRWKKKTPLQFRKALARRR